MFTEFDRQQLVNIAVMVARLLGQEEGHFMASVADIKAKLDALAAQVATNTSVIDSAVTVLQGLQQQVLDLTAALQNAGVDQALVDQAQAIADAIGASDTKLGAAIAAGTPAQP